MEHLVAQVPELKLRKRTETRTIHKNDLVNYPNNKVGDVLTFVFYTDDNGRTWSKADLDYYIKADLDYYIKVCNLLDPIEIPEEELA